MRLYTVVNGRKTDYLVVFARQYQVVIWSIPKWRNTGCLRPCYKVHHLLRSSFFNLGNINCIYEVIRRSHVAVHDRIRSLYSLISYLLICCIFLRKIFFARRSPWIMILKPDDQQSKKSGTVYVCRKSHVRLDIPVGSIIKVLNSYELRQCG